MPEQQNASGVIAQARAQQQPVANQQPAVQPAPQQAVQPETVQQYQQPQQGFGGQQYANPFVQQPIPQAVPEPVQQPIQTENPRTQQQFEKLTDTNQRLAQQIDRLQQEMQQLNRGRQQTQNQFAPVQQQTQQPAQVPGQPAQVMPKLSDYVEIDPNTGERVVNEAKFNAAVQEIYQKASRAEEVVKNYVQQAEQREVERNEREAFSKYPELNPRGSSFDGEFAKQTRAYVYDSLLNPQDYPNGRSLSFKDAADLIRGGMPSIAVPTPTVNAQNHVQKEQAAATFQQIPQQVSQSQDVEREYQRQVMGTRLGSNEAIAVRLLNATHRQVDVEGQA